MLNELICCKWPLCSHFRIRRCFELSSDFFYSDPAEWQVWSFLTCESVTLEPSREKAFLQQLLSLNSPVLTWCVSVVSGTFERQWRLCWMCYTCVHVCRHLFVPWGSVLNDGSDLGAAVSGKATLIHPTDWSDKSFIKPSVSLLCHRLERPVQHVDAPETPVKGWRSGCQPFYTVDTWTRTRGRLWSWFLHGLHQSYLTEQLTQDNRNKFRQTGLL